MRRGSVHTWEDYGRRSSANMSPFSSSRAEFMTIDDIEYKRNDGWFVSYPKLAAAIVVFIIGVLAAGFIGWYIHTSPRKKVYDTLDIINEDMEEDAIIGTSSLAFVHPLKYDLNLVPIIEADGVSKITGRVLIEFRVDDAVSISKLNLNAKNITATGYKLLSVHQEEVKIEDNETAGSIDMPRRLFTEIPIVEYKEDESKLLHVIYLGRPIKQGIYNLEIDYECLINDENFYHGNYSESDNKWLIGTKLAALGVSSVFPLFEDTQLKTPFSLAVARPSEMRVLSNMPLSVSKDSSIDEVVDIFSESIPLSAHNLAFTMGHIESTSEKFIVDSKVRAAFWSGLGTRSQGTYLADKLEPTVINLIDMFAVPYPLAKLDLLSLPAGINQDIGKPGLISIKQSEWITMEESPVIIKAATLRSLIYLIGLQWLEGIVNMNLTDIWVHESSLLYLQYTLANKIDPSLESSNSFLVDVQFDAMDTDGYSVFRSLHTNVNHLHSDPFNDRYMKGACLIRMLHAAVGNTAFVNGYRQFIQKWKFSTTNAVEFFESISQNTSDILPDISVAEIMDPWILQSGYPIVFVMRDYEAGTIKVHQAQFTYDTLLDESDKLWHIPLTYVNETGDWSHPEVIWLLSEREMVLQDFNYNNESWIVFNINKTGYYRVNYDENNWMLLSAALQEDHNKFPPETRASLIDDIFSLAAIGLVEYKTAFEFIKYMQVKERHYAPWGIFMKHMFKLNKLLYETSVFTEFQEFMLNFISPLYNEFGIIHEDGTELALISIQMACEFEHAECVDRAKEAFANMQIEPEAKESIPVQLREIIYCTIARYGSRKEWNYYVENTPIIADKDERERFLSSMSCFQTPWILQTILIEIVQGSLFRENEIPVILQSFSKNPAAAQVASRFVRSNWQDIIKRFSGSYSLLKSFVLSMLNGLTTEQDQEDLQMFRDNNFEDLKGARYATAVVEANANFVISWLKNSFPEVELLLNRNVTTNALEDA